MLVHSVFLLTLSNVVVMLRLGDPIQTNSPLIIIPGDAGNQVYAHEKDKPREKPSLLWFNLRNVFRMSKLTEELSLTYDPKTHTTHDNEKYEVIFPGWGDTSTIEYLDTTEHVFGEYLHGYQMYLDSTGEFDTFRNPTGVQVICVHGSQVSTPVSLTYPRKGWFHKGFPDETPTITDGDGDGTVPIRSLEVCRQWVNTEHVVLPGAAHIPITTDPRFLTVLRRVLGSHISLVERETGHQIEDDVREI
ncbi:hypothetical protein P879_07550 [Paragonimus westermani]|uniref:Uncharacterized protein n=1 Tax=Paragonimus westermani TaxID=34504 RepID=A0A8T0DJQ2_9TREM|nr:hypothetical protein P879_07550 [Paragonimus westermani]